MTAVSRILFLAAIAALLFGLSVAQSPPLRTRPAPSPSPSSLPAPEASASAPILPQQVALMTLPLPPSAPSPSTFTSLPSPPSSTFTGLPGLASSSPPVEGPLEYDSGAVTNKFALSAVLAAGFAAALAV
ncbi:uncharacterized protein J3R85_004989 [Psidium guajava]|nr:uncharacterized protein J3R85_004989 [Psidium guajava]